MRPAGPSCLAALALAVAAAPADADPEPMASVGRLQFATESACTGTLIAPDLVLTAGHCVARIRSGAIAPGDVRFVTGAYPGHDAHPSVVADVTMHPFYVPALGRDQQHLKYDVALVRLEGPVPPDVAIPVEVAEVGPDDAVPLIASYRGGQPERARERRCPILAHVGSLLTLSCDVRKGESGAPVLTLRDGSLALIGVVSATSRVKRTEVALAAPAAPVLGVLEALLLPRPGS